MAKHTYGFSSETRDKDGAVADAIDMALRDGFLHENEAYETEVLETDAHKENQEFVVIIRTNREGSLG